MTEPTHSPENGATADHPHADPGDGRQECQTCGKWVWLVTHSCKGIPVTQAAMDRRIRPASDPNPAEDPS